MVKYAAAGALQSPGMVKYAAAGALQSPGHCDSSCCRWSDGLAAIVIPNCCRCPAVSWQL
eukprot:scaffold122314_cov17-Tisochrysis_lutea.AAC.4